MNYPPEDLGLNTADVKILWMLSNNPHCRWSHFINEPLKIPSATLSKYINRMIEKDYIERQLGKEGKKIYKITSKGERELIRRFDKAELDFYEMIELERKKIQSQVSKLSPFFKKYEISDDVVKIDFLYLYNKIIQDESLSLYSKEKFNKLLLYIVLNDIKFNDKLEKVLSSSDFIKAYNIDFEESLTETDIHLFIQEAVDRNRYQTKIFKIPLERNDTYLFFREDSEAGIIFETVIKKNLKNLNYLKTLDNSEIYLSDLEDIKTPIMYDLIKRYKIFNSEIEQKIFHLVDEYILDLQLKLHEKPTIKLEEIGDMFAVYTRWVGFTPPFKPLSDEDENELSDVRYTFRRIREKDPKNKSLSTASELLYDKKPELALVEIDNYLETDPRDHEALELKSKILFELGNFQKAFNLFEIVHKNFMQNESPIESAHTQSYKIELLIGLKRYDEALLLLKDFPQIFKTEKEFYEFLEDDYVFIRLYKSIAIIHYEQKDYEKALTAIDKDLGFSEILLDMQEEDSLIDSYILKSEILSMLGMFNDSIQTISKAISLNPTDAELYYKRANTLSAREIFKSIFDIQRAMHYNPTNKKYQDFYNSIAVLPFYSLSGVDKRVRIVKEIDRFLNDGLGEKTIERLYQFIVKSESIKNELFPLKEGDEVMEFIKGEINFLEALGVIKLENGIVYQGQKLLKHYFVDLEKDYNFSLILFFHFNLLHIFNENNWIKISKDILINKIQISTEGASISRENLGGIAKSFLEVLIDEKFLIESDRDYLTLDRKKIEEDFEKYITYDNTSFKKLKVI
jgi:tetratricopeptide (TPR) repeat protein